MSQPIEPTLPNAHDPVPFVSAAPTPDPAIDVQHEPVPAGAVVATPVPSTTTGLPPVQEGAVATTPGGAPTGAIVAPNDGVVVTGGPEPTPAPTPSMGNVGANDQETVKASSSALDTAKAAIVAAIDTALDETTDAITTINDDLVAAAASAILEAETSPQVAGWVKSILGIASPVANALDAQIDAKLLAGVQWLRSKL